MRQSKKIYKRIYGRIYNRMHKSQSKKKEGGRLQKIESQKMQHQEKFKNISERNIKTILETQAPISTPHIATMSPNTPNTQTLTDTKTLPWHHRMIKTTPTTNIIIQKLTKSASHLNQTHPSNPPNMSVSTPTTPATMTDPSISLNSKMCNQRRKSSILTIMKFVKWQVMLRANMINTREKERVEESKSKEYLIYWM